VKRHAEELEFAVRLARAAGTLVLESYGRVGRVRHKSRRDVVTEVDFKSEALIAKRIRARYPDDGILAEEAGGERVDGTDGARRWWAVDPLDGTVNYANGLPHFCVSVGLIVDGRPVAGAVHDPMRAETFWATADGEAHLGEVVIRASVKERLDDFVIAMAVGGRAATSRARAVRRAVRVARNMGSSALAMAYVARGRFDGFIQSGGMSAWDIAAAGLIAERAGAVVTDANGGPWFDVAKATRMFGTVAAPAPHHAELLRLSREPIQPPREPARA
jgi:myo-inositol-1(or 4)-monophosphatase